MKRFLINPRSGPALVATAALLAGCGGGGGSSSLAPPQQQGSSTAQYPTSKLVISFAAGTSSSSNVRAPKYVSPSTTQLRVTVNTINGTAAPSGAPFDTTTALSTTGGSPNCTISGGTETCTISVITPPGSVNYTFSAEDATPVVLATLTKTLSNTAGNGNLLPVTLQGVVSIVEITAASLHADDTSHATTGEPVTVTAFDHDLNQIVDGTTPANYANPIKLTDNDPTAATKLVVNGGTPSSTVVVTKPSDVVTLVYSGLAVNPVSITPSDTAASPFNPIDGGLYANTVASVVDDITLTGTLDDTTAHNPNASPSDPNYGQQTLFFAQASGSQTIGAAELGYTDAPFGRQFVVDMGNGTGGTCGTGGGVVTVTNPNTPATTFTVNATGTGICKMRIKETGAGYPLTNHAANTSGSETHDGTFWVSVTSANVNVTGIGRQTSATNARLPRNGIHAHVR
jgi:hypothetical protein